MTRDDLMYLLRALFAIALLFGFPLLAAHCQNLPDAPSAIDNSIKPKRRAGLFAGRRWSDPPLRNPFRTKTFDAAFAIYGLADFADSAITHHRAGRTHYPNGVPCYEAQNPTLSAKPSNGELWASGGIEFGAMLGFGWLNARYTWLPISWGMAGYGTGKHVEGALSWRSCQ